MATRTSSSSTPTNGTGGASSDKTLAVAQSAMGKLDDTKTAQAIVSGLQTMSDDARSNLVSQLAPDQAVTNEIWRIIVKTFALVLVLAVAALVAAVVVSFWRKLDAAMIQIAVTVFTTTAGILAGFISGRMSRTT